MWNQRGCCVPAVLVRTIAMPSSQNSLCLHPLCYVGLVWSSGVGLSGADKQLVPADHSLPHVHLIKPDVSFPDQGLLHKLPPV